MPGETKEQRKARKRLEKAQHEQAQETVPSSTEKRYVVCLKWGDKYSPDYVNNLYNMVKRNCTVDYEFICFTENSKGIDKHITVRPLPVLPVKGWWYKPWFLSDKLGIEGTALFLDLDLIVFESIDQMWTYKQDCPFVIIRDFNRHARANWDRMNSSVFRFKIGAYSSIYNEFEKNAAAISKRFQGDQDWMYRSIKDHAFWPDEWIQSYKWEMRGKEHLTFKNGKRNFSKPAEPKILPQTRIAVFHGQPDIHDCIDTWPRRNWY